MLLVIGTSVESKQPKCPNLVVLRHDPKYVTETLAGLDEVVCSFLLNIAQGNRSPKPGGLNPKRLLQDTEYKAVVISEEQLEHLVSGLAGCVDELVSRFEKVSSPELFEKIVRACVATFWLIDPHLITGYRSGKLVEMGSRGRIPGVTPAFQTVELLSRELGFDTDLSSFETNDLEDILNSLCILNENTIKQSYAFSLLSSIEKLAFTKVSSLITPSDSDTLSKLAREISANIRPKSFLSFCFFGSKREELKTMGKQETVSSAASNPESKRSLEVEQAEFEQRITRNLDSLAEFFEALSVLQTQKISLDNGKESDQELDRKISECIRLISDEQGLLVESLHAVKTRWENYLSSDSMNESTWISDAMKAKLIKLYYFVSLLGSFSYHVHLVTVGKSNKIRVVKPIKALKVPSLILEIINRPKTDSRGIIGTLEDFVETISPWCTASSQVFPETLENAAFSLEKFGILVDSKSPPSRVRYFWSLKYHAALGKAVKEVLKE
ncbi:MAG: hypothetical protein N2654_02500 [Deltaproteobacteria bacterium]|nr:hypothetical protein [Deltaproteobacteria bacterium]